MDDCKGFVVLSMSGRDKNNTFVAVATDDGYAYCADGRIHPVASPKKKKLKHIRILGKSSVTDISAVTNKQLRAALREFEAENAKHAPEKEE